MSEKIRVLYRYYAGLPFRQASDKEKKNVMKSWKETTEKWKSLGVNLIGSFSGLSNPGGFCHYMIFEVDSLEIMNKMNSDVMGGAIGKYSERYDFSIGSGSMENLWANPTSE